MINADSEICPLCTGPANFIHVDLRRKHFKCKLCTEFVLWRSAESRLRGSAKQTLQNLAAACRQTTNPEYIYVIKDPKDATQPHVDLQGEAQLRSMALA